MVDHNSVVPIYPLVAPLQAQYSPQSLIWSWAWLVRNPDMMTDQYPTFGTHTSARPDIRYYIVPAKFLPDSLKEFKILPKCLNV